MRKGILLTKDPSLVKALVESYGDKWIVLVSDQITDAIEFYPFPAN